MPVQLTHFDEVALPVLNPRQDHSPAPILPRFVPSIGGASFDAYGDDDAPPQVQTIPLTGVVWGETLYLADEAGNLLVDEAGNYVIAGTEATVLRSRLAALAEKHGKVGTLWRTRLDDGVRQWKRASFAMEQPQIASDRLFKATITCQFVTNMAYWHAETATTVGVSAGDGEWAYLMLYNAGKTIHDAVVTVACTSGTITSVLFRSEAMGIDIGWLVTLETGNTLVIDNGNGAVAEGAVGANGGLFFNGGHSAAGWLPIPPGTSVLGVLLAGGDAEIDVTFYNQTP